MAISRIKTSSVLQGFPKSRSLLAGNTAFNPSSYESIATVTVGSGGAANVEFTSIPATYTHLQVRGIARTAKASAPDVLRIRFNSDTGNNYARHLLYGDGTSALAAGAGSGNLMSLGTIGANNSTADAFSGHIIDVLDYKDTNKYKTLRALNGFSNNTSSNEEISLTSGLWQNTNAITSILIFADSASNLSQYTQFALYGIKGS